MDTTVIVQISFYGGAILLAFIVLFAFFRFLLISVFVRKSKRANSRSFTPHYQQNTNKRELDFQIMNLAKGSTIEFVGQEGQSPDATCRKTGTPIKYCDCSRCKRLHGKVRN